jgi:hypothetical protein
MEYLIWSTEHQGWWKRPEGYTTDIIEAMAMTRDQALAFCRHHGRLDEGDMPTEIPVAIRDLNAVIKPYNLDSKA